MKLDAAVAKQLESAIFRTWDQIAADVYQIAQDCEEQLTNIAAMEFCIDADRLLLNGDSADANQLVRQLCVEHGYEKVLKFLSKRIQLA